RSLARRRSRRARPLGRLARPRVASGAGRGARGPARATGAHVTSVAVRVPAARARAFTLTQVASFFFLATLVACTFEKVHWNVPGAGDVNVADLLALCFLGSFAIVSRPRVPQTVVVVLAFFAAFLLVYLCGFFNLETAQALQQFVKGMVKFVIHFLFLAV